MSQLQQPLNLQEERCERQLSQEANCQVYEPLCEVQLSLMNYVFVIYQRRMESQATSLIQVEKNETWRTLNWENPGKAEYEAVMEILKQQKELLQQDVNEGRDTSLNQLIMSVLRSLWKYFLFNSKRRGALRLNFTSVHHHSEQRESDQVIPLLSANLPQNHDVHERDSTFKQHLKMLLHYLKQSTPGWRAHYSLSTRYNEDQEFDILNAHPVL